jgi:hypothetical protein
LNFTSNSPEVPPTGATGCAADSGAAVFGVSDANHTACHAKVVLDVGQAAVAKLTTRRRGRLSSYSEDPTSERHAEGISLATVALGEIAGGDVWL